MDTLPPGVFMVMAGASAPPNSAPLRGMNSALTALMTTPITMAAMMTTTV